MKLYTLALSLLLALSPCSLHASDTPADQPATTIEPRVSVPALVFAGAVITMATFGLVATAMNEEQ